MRPAWHAWGALARHGLVGLLAFALRTGPGALMLAFGVVQAKSALVLLGTLIAAGGTYLIPCFMSFYCVDFGPKNNSAPRFACIPAFSSSRRASLERKT